MRGTSKKRLSACYYVCSYEKSPIEKMGAALLMDVLEQLPFDKKDYEQEHSSQTKEKL